MNLYTIDFGHWGPKDSVRGIAGFYLANDNEEVLDKLLCDPNFFINSSMPSERYFNSWYDRVHDNEDEQIKRWGELYYNRLIRTQGELWDEDNEYAFSDLYYGVTLIGWTLIKENVTEEEQITLIGLGAASRIKHL